MKISRIEIFVLEAPLTRPFGFSQWTYSKRTNTLIRIFTDDGLCGYGECYGPALPISSALKNFYGPKIIGMDPRQTEAIWSHLWRSSLDFARRGIMMAALSGIDIALWDIRAKAAGMPLWMLLGGDCKAIPCYATGMYFRQGLEETTMMESLLEEAGRYVKEGYPLLKIKIGKNPAFDQMLIRNFRKIFPDHRLAADSNHAYSYKEALLIGEILSENRYEWFEEPLSPENTDDMAGLRERSTVPIAAGECEQTRWGFQALAKARSLDIFQPDLAYCGGISEFLKISAIASANHIDLVPHVWGLRINHAAAAAVISALPDNPGRAEKKSVFLETDQTEHPVRDGIFTKAPAINKGFLHLDKAPGLGVEIDEKAMARFVVSKEVC